MGGFWSLWWFGSLLLIAVLAIAVLAIAVLVIAVLVIAAFVIAIFVEGILEGILIFVLVAVGWGVGVWGV